MLDTAILTALSDLTRRLRERTGDSEARAYMEIRGHRAEPLFTVWLHAAGLEEKGNGCTFINTTSAPRALWLADDYLAIDTVHRALQWLDEVAWVESSWTEPGGIPRGVIHRAEIKQEAAQLWCADHPAAVAAEREARRAAQYRAMLKGADVAFATERRKAS